MIAASVKDSEKLVVFLLSKGAEPNEKSEFWRIYSDEHERSLTDSMTDNAGQAS